MKKKNLLASLSVIAAFVIWTILVSVVDVKNMGPNASTVGFSTLNGCVHKAMGVHMSLYAITDWLGLVPLATALGFAIFGFAQWIKRGSILKVDRSILALGVFYIVVMSAYIFFETIVINYRPVLINGHLEASYPSSTTMLVMCVMPTALIQLKHRIEKIWLRKFVVFAIMIFIAFMVIGRAISGVHWITDIIGGALLSIGLVQAYLCCVNQTDEE